MPGLSRCGTSRFTIVSADLPGASGRLAAARRVAGGDRVGQRVGDELGAQVIGQGEPDDAAGGDIDHGRQIEPPSQVAR